MRTDIGYILGHLIEFIFFVYFVNMSFLPKKGYLYANIAAFAGYLILFAVGMLGYPYISVVSFALINFFLMTVFYHIEIRRAAFYSLALDLLSVVGEYIIMYFLGVYYSEMPLYVTPKESLIITIGGKLIYLIGIVFLRRSVKVQTTTGNNYLPVLSAVPAITIIILSFMMTSNMEYYLFCITCILFMLINIIVFAVNEIINKKNSELKILQEECSKNNAELEEYKLLSEKYENTRIMRHDLKNQLSILKELIDTGGSVTYKYISQLEQSQRELNYTQYTDNKILNILLSRKIKESNDRGVKMHIQSTGPSFSRISETDVVAVFSNLLDNAIEAAEKSTEKVIFIDLYTVNNIYSIAKVENSADKEPVVLNGILQTQKQKYDIHGWGIKSINNALKKYGSQLVWSYDKENKFFRTIVSVRVRSTADKTV